MTFGELQTEFYARGFDYLNEQASDQARAKAWINEGYLEDICDLEPWPFLETGTIDAGNITLTDLRDVLWVTSLTDATHGERLPSVDSRTLVETWGDPTLARTGTPECYYLQDTGTTTTIVPYPISDGAVSVRYIKVPPLLSADDDEPVLPERYHPLIVDAAVIRAYRDSDNWDGANILQQHLDRRIVQMRDALFSRQLDNSQFIVRTDPADY